MTVPVAAGSILIAGNESADPGAGCVIFRGLVPLGSGVKVAAGQRSTTQPSLEDCWRLCTETPPCNVFAYCDSKVRLAPRCWRRWRLGVVVVWWWWKREARAGPPLATCADASRSLPLRPMPRPRPTCLAPALTATSWHLLLRMGAPPGPPSSGRSPLGAASCAASPLQLRAPDGRWLSCRLRAAGLEVCSLRGLPFLSQAVTEKAVLALTSACSLSLLRGAHFVRYRGEHASH